MALAPPVSAFFVARDEDRSQAPVKFLNGRFDCKVSARDTAGALCIFDTVRTRPGGPPLHFHLQQDEWFFVQEGRFRARIGEEERELGPGDSFFGPRGVPHAFALISQTGRMLIAFQPAGSMEAFFSAELMDPMSEEFRDLSRQHGMEVVGPPLPL